MTRYGVGGVGLAGGFLLSPPQTLLRSASGMVPAISFRDRASLFVMVIFILALGAGSKLRWKPGPWTGAARFEVRHITQVPGVWRPPGVPSGRLWAWLLPGRRPPC